METRQNQDKTSALNERAIAFHARLRAFQQPPSEQRARLLSRLRYVIESNGEPLSLDKKMKKPSPVIGMCFEESRPLIASPRRLKPVLGKKKEKKEKRLLFKEYKNCTMGYTREIAQLLREFSGKRINR